MGKRISRFNNLGEGIYAEELILPGESEGELEARYADWVDQLGARTGPEQYEVKNAVHASWRHDRLRRSDTAALRDLVETTAQGFHARKEQETRAQVERLAEAPGEAVAVLRGSTSGLAWMISQIELFHSEVDTCGALAPSSRVRLIHLLGKRLVDLFEDSAVWHWNRLEIAACARDDLPKMEVAQNLLSGDRPPSMDPPEFGHRLKLLIADLPAWAVAPLRLHEKLSALREELIERQELIALKEERELARAIEQAKFDAAPQGDKRRRAENSLERIRHASFKELRAHQKARHEAEASTDSPNPDPDPDNRPGEHAGATRATGNGRATGTAAGANGAAGSVNTGTTAATGKSDPPSKCKNEPTCQNGSHDEAAPEAFPSPPEDQYTEADASTGVAAEAPATPSAIPMTIDEEIQAGLALHQAGRLAEAQAVYRRVLARAPDHPQALHFLGGALLQAGDTAAAIELIGRAVALEPQNGFAQSNLGEAHLRAGHWSAAIACARRAIELEPRLAAPYVNLGAALTHLGQTDEAIAACQQAVDRFPDRAHAHSNLGLALQAAGRLDEAVAAFERAMALAPHVGEIHVNLGNALKEQGRLDSAIVAYRRALERNPDDVVALSNLGVALHEAERSDEAIAAYRRALELKPDDADTLVNLSVALQATGRLDEAIAAGRRAVALEGDAAVACSNLALALRTAGRQDEAIAALGRAIELDPGLAAAYNNLGDALHDAGQLDEAIAALRRAIELKPEDADAGNNLGNVLKDQGRQGEALAAFRAAVAVKPGFARVASNILYTLHSHPDYDAQAILAEHRRWAERYAAPLAAAIRPHENNRTPGRRLRLGYVSPDFRAHAVGQLLRPLLAHHDRDRFEVVCYSDVRLADAVTDELRARADRWCDIAGQSDAQVAERIRADQVDILVDLALHTAGNRMPVFARKPAPVQVTMLGLPATTGLDTIDYRLTDPYLDPPGQTDADYTERSIRLPHCFWVFQPPGNAGAFPVAPLPARVNGFVTFGCLNQLAKVTPPALALWAEVLRRLPGSRLVLQSPPGRHLAAVRAPFQRAGIAGDRLECVARAPRDEYLHRFDHIDIALDPFPYNGHTSTLDALWMGVPVVTLAGRTAVGRGGVSILSNINLSEMIAFTSEDYITRAVELGRDLERLAELRMRLRTQLMDSPVADARRYRADVEAALVEMWRAWCGTRG
jgi:predicted O-linked N-acetylglucosamine transferase (SPINDLY family)